jgi:hypothetical protein
MCHQPSVCSRGGRGNPQILVGMGSLSTMWRGRGAMPNCGLPARTRLPGALLLLMPCRASPSTSRQQHLHSRGRICARGRAWGAGQRRRGPSGGCRLPAGQGPALPLRGHFQSCCDRGRSGCSPAAAAAARPRLPGPAASIGPPARQLLHARCTLRQCLGGGARAGRKWQHTGGAAAAAGTSCAGSYKWQCAFRTTGGSVCFAAARWCWQQRASPSYVCTAPSTSP